ncbi:S8 family serine peptidase [Pseudomonadota bacterium]
MARTPNKQSSDKVNKQRSGKASKKATKKKGKKTQKSIQKKRSTKSRKGAQNKKTVMARSPRSKPISQTLKIAVTLPRPIDGLGPVRMATRMTTQAAHHFIPEQQTIDNALHELERLGFTITGKGQLTFSVRGSRSNFEKVFGTKLSKYKVENQPEGFCAVDSFYFPKPGAPWKPAAKLKSLIDDAYIQWPHIYMNDLFPSRDPSPIPPRVNYHHLRVPGDVNLLLNVPKIHREGGSGVGVRVAMIDSGFAHGHAYFERMGYNTSTVLAPGATDADLDGNSHGTGESANLLAIAPDVNFIGVKLDNETDPNNGATVLEGFQEAMRHSPQVISVSLGFDLADRPSGKHLTSLPNSLVALEAEIEAAVANGVVVVFAAGNGHVAFPGMMPDVISAGGVYVHEDGAMRASDYASAFASKIYPGRHVPDFCGLVGLADNHADYIMLPIQEQSEIDVGNSAHDGTSSGDGWGVFSGTSAAAPQLAGVCALLLERNPGLTPVEVKELLRLTSIDVTTGNANPASNHNGGGLPAGIGPDSATGMGLVDAHAAWKMV